MEYYALILFYEVEMLLSCFSSHLIFYDYFTPYRIPLIELFGLGLSILQFFNFKNYYFSDILIKHICFVT